MKTLVLFGSQSDSYIYDPFVNELRKHVDVEFQVLSAHRNPHELDDLLSRTDADCIFAGAGLAAHLPGVIASKVSVPVVGIPVESQLGGIDALMSIQQMPFGVPVLSVAPGEWTTCTQFVHQWIDWGLSKRNINLVVNPKIMDYEYVGKELLRTKNLLADKKLSYSINEEVIDNEFNIVLADDIEKVQGNLFGIHVPLLDPRNRSNYVKALDIYNWTKKGGLWVGINNTRNAILMYEKLFK